MGKREAGSSEPAHDPELCECERPDTARHHDNPGCDCAQLCLSALFRQYSDAMSGIDPDEVVYDSGWDHSSGIPVRVVMGKGAENPALWHWVRRTALGVGVGTDKG